MSGIVDRYTPSDPYPRLLLALLASCVPMTLFLFGTVVVINMWQTEEALQGVPGLTLAALFVLTVLSSHVAHVLVSDVAERARGQEDMSETGEHTAATTESGATGTAGDPSEMGRSGTGTQVPDPQTTLEQRYVAGELTDEEFERRMETLTTSRAARSADRIATDRLTE